MTIDERIAYLVSQLPPVTEAQIEAAARILASVEQVAA